MALRKALRPFQQQDIDAALRGGGRWFFMHEPGLGKTAMGLGVGERLIEGHGARTVLCLVKASLRANWAREIVRWTGRVPRVWTPDGPQGLDTSIYQVAGYETAVKFERELKALRPDLVIMDETHARLRNPATYVARSVLSIRAPWAIALSATPCLNGPTEIFPVLHYLRPDLFPSKRAFLKEFGGGPAASGWGRDPARNLAWLHRMLRACASRRTVEEVAPEMPTVQESEVWLTLEPKALDRYRAIEDAVLAAWGRKRPNATDLHPLLEALEEVKLASAWQLMDDLLAAGKTVLLFSHWKAPVYKTAARYRHIGAFAITSDQEPGTRQALVDEMESGKRRCGALTLGVGAEGLNIPTADTVIHLDLEWVPDVHTQATARARRLTSTHATIQSYFMLAAETVDEHLWAMQRGKAAATSMIVTGAPMVADREPAGFREFVRRLRTAKAGA